MLRKLTHCPHCGKELVDSRFDANGYPRPDTTWVIDDGRGPATRLLIKEVEPGNRLGREIRGHLSYRTRKGGTEYDPDGAVQTYSTSLEVFHATWGRPDPNKPVDRSLMIGEI